MAHTPTNPHLVLLPSLGVGHLMPLLHLSQRLASRDFTVSLLLTPHHSHIAQSKLQGLDLPIRIHQLPVSLPLLPTINSNANTNILPPLMTLSEDILRRPVEDLLTRMFHPADHDPPPPLCIISDFFLPWTTDLAAKFNIPRINVETSPAYSMNVVDTLWIRLPQNLERTSSGRYIVPGQAKPMVIGASEMTPGLPEADESHPKHIFYSRVFATNRERSRVTVSNTFYELEAAHIDKFQTRYAGPVRPIGPLLSYPVGDCLPSPEVEFLDGRAHGSVVYVSFGSENSISCAEMMELALGLEGSGKGFLWVFRPPCDAPNRGLETRSMSEFLPEGFIPRTEDRGRVVNGWTDQVAVLSHPAVGAFISHCGWNSVLEAIVCGVPMICWPLYAEQPFNAKFVVEEAACGIMVQKPADKEQIQAIVRSLVDDNVGDDEREGVKAVRLNARKWKEKARAAACEGGSSANNFDCLVNDILSFQKMD